MTSHKPRYQPVVLYSSALLIILSGISAWLNTARENPTEVRSEQLSAITEQLQILSQSLDSQEKIMPQNTTTTVMAWLYPGEPACNAMTEAARYQPDVIKPEYFVIRDGGRLEFMTEELYGCNGYSNVAIEQVKAISSVRFVTVSAANASDMSAFLRHDELTGEGVATFARFVREHSFSGVELDFEDYGSWTPDIYLQYKDFIERLGTELRHNGKELMVTLPPVRNVDEERRYTHRLADFNQLPIDHIVVMAYDYQFDHGVGEPVAPLGWLAEVISYTKANVTDDTRIVIGLPTYGYVADHDTGVITILTHDQASKYIIFDQAERDSASQELIARNSKYTLVYQDEVSIQAKVNVVTQNNLEKISFWHLGGNPWYFQ